jgi:hypothetical protein
MAISDSWRGSGSLCGDPTRPSLGRITKYGRTSIAVDVKVELPFHLASGIIDGECVRTAAVRYAKHD